MSGCIHERMDCLSDIIIVSWTNCITDTYTSTSSQVSIYMYTLSGNAFDVYVIHSFTGVSTYIYISVSFQI